MNQYEVKDTIHDHLEGLLNRKAKEGFDPISIFFEQGRGIVVVFKRDEGSAVKRNVTMRDA